MANVRKSFTREMMLKEEIALHKRHLYIAAIENRLRIEPEELGRRQKFIELLEAGLAQEQQLSRHSSNEFSKPFDNLRETLYSQDAASQDVDIDINAANHPQKQQPGRRYIETPQKKHSGGRFIDAGHQPGGRFIDAGHQPGGRFIDAGHQPGGRFIEAGSYPQKQLQAGKFLAQMDQQLSPHQQYTFVPIRQTEKSHFRRKFPQNAKLVALKKPPKKVGLIEEMELET